MNAKVEARIARAEGADRVGPPLFRMLVPFREEVDAIGLKECYGVE